MYHKLYHSPVEKVVFKDLTRARRAFTKAALVNERVALVSEDGLNFRVTFNEPSNNEMITRFFGEYEQVMQYLNEVF